MTNTKNQPRSLKTPPATLPPAGADDPATRPKAMGSDALRAELVARDLGNLPATPAASPAAAPSVTGELNVPVPQVFADPPIGEKAKRLRDEANRRAGGAAKYAGWRTERQKRMQEMAREHFRRERVAYTARALADYAELEEVQTEEALALGYSNSALRRLVARATAAGIRFDAIMAMIVPKP